MKVIIYEGLFGFFWNKMSKAFEEACPGVSYEKRSWTSNKDIPNDAIVIGHSFGAYKAWCKCRTSGYKYLITVDMRWWSGNKDYERLAFADHYNFYQLKGLRGYRLKKGAHKVFESNLGYHGHMEAPSHYKVIGKIRAVCS